MTTTKSWLPGYTSRQISRRKFLGGAAAGAGAAALIACGGSDGGGIKFEDAGTARQPGKVWNAANDWKLADETKEAVKGGIYPDHMSADQAGSYDALLPAPSQVPFSDHVHESLMARNKGIGVDPASLEAGVPVPALAQAFEVSDDGLTVTFTLRPNVKWQPVAPVNGRVMDMDDWKTTHERFMALSAQREVLLDVLASVQYPDASHMVWKLKYPYSPLADRIHSERVAWMLFPKELNRDQNLAESVAVGTGYKILDRHQRSVTMEYRKHTEYWGGEPFIDRWHFPIIPEYANRYAQFLTQSIMDLTPSGGDVISMAKDAPGAVIVANPPTEDFTRFHHLSFGRENMENSPWRDPRVRIALRRSLDMNGMGAFLGNKQQLEAAGLPAEIQILTAVPPDPRYWLNPEKGELGKLSENYLYDLTAARQLVSAAGFSMPIEINHYTLPGGGGSLPDYDQLSIDALNQGGVFKPNVIRSLNTVEHRNCRSLRQCSGYARTTLPDPDVDYLLAEYSSSGSRPGGEPAITDPRIDSGKDSYRREQDQAKRIQILKDLQAVYAEFMPSIPFISLHTTFSFRWPWLHNINHGDGVTGRPVLGSHRQWLDPNMPRRNG
jgi:ABC-type transport system substrate-binding protein